ncbi:hypothetical protein GCM10023165_35240 [Variovorax defluvii]|uniref:Uncharacterized protein n=1 Tax=Variovorax defluvii TaxID=913761 RepID=A0ABP8I0T7_9BURK
MGARIGGCAPWAKGQALLAGAVVDTGFIEGTPTEEEGTGGERRRGTPAALRQREGTVSPA